MTPGDSSVFAGTRLCVVGNVNRDLRLAPIDATEQLFHDGETPTASVRETLGGGGANSALAAAALGAKVAFAGKIGDDALGRRIGRTLADRGIDAHLRHGAHVATGTSVNLVWTTGHRHFVSCLPNATSLTFDDIDLSAMAGCQHLLRADPWFSEPMLFDGGNRKLFEAARGAGLAVSLDINTDPWAARDASVAAQRRGALCDALPLVDLAHGNIAELCAFTSTQTLDAALSLLEDAGIGAVVVHMGERGAGYWRRGQLIVEPAISLDEPALNTTGTGDVLSVCMILLHAREDLNAREKLRISNTVVARYMTGQLAMTPDLVE